ncbi:MAG: hypothetical protein RR942_06455 [Romboutsia sp.]
MERKLNLKKGDKCIVAIMPRSNAARHVNMSLENINNWTCECEVISVGRKYIEVKYGNNSTMQFDMTNNYWEKSIYSPDYVLYENLEEIVEKEKREDLHYKIKRAFEGYREIKYTLDQLIRINNILEEK